MPPPPPPAINATSLVLPNHRQEDTDHQQHLLDLQQSSNKNHPILPHVAICMMSAKGHIQPAIILAQQLAKMGVFITILCCDRSAHSLLTCSSDSRDYNSMISIQMLVEEDSDDSAPSVPSPRTVMKGVRRSHYTAADLSDLNRNFLIVNRVSDFQQHLESRLRSFADTGSPVCCVIVDMLFSWTQPVLRKLKIPKYILYTAAATHIALSRHAKTLYDEGALPAPPETGKIVVPGIPALRWQDIPDHIRDPMHPYHSLDWDEHMFDAEGILLNTAWEVEGKVIDAIRSQIPGARSLPKRLLPLGPLIPSCFFRDGSEDVVLASPKWQEQKCRAFLDSQPDSSVVYVSFGSLAALEERQILELAAALENSGSGFLWVLPIPPEYASSSAEYVMSVLPEGFVARTRDRGMVVEDWAPQHLVLSHAALGGFVTHCGWNSVLECIAVAGAPMLCWPFTADQPVTCRYLVAELKIAVDFEGADCTLDRDDIERALRRLMSGPEAESMKERALKLKSALRASVLEESGSSRVNLKDFVDEIFRKTEPPV